MVRALEVLKQDKRVVDYCGFNLKPGYIIKKEKRDEDTIKFSFKIKGESGHLDTILFGDS